MSRKRLTKKLISIILGLVLVVVVPYIQRSLPKQTVVPVEPGYYRITEFNDGDTVTIDMNGTKERIRMIGVDTPETQDPRKQVQCFGKAASAFTKELIGSNPIRLEADPLNTNRDRYNRLLRYVYLPDNTLVNARLIEQGYGFAYTSFPFSKAEEFRAAEKLARNQNRGLWGSCKPTENEYGGFTSNDEL